MDLMKKRQWSVTASYLIGDCFDLCRPFLESENNKIDPFTKFVIAQLFINCHLSSESALILIQHEKEWDAEIIERSLIEGSVKFFYLTTGTEEETKQKAHEYWNIIPDMSSLRKSDKIAETLSVIPEPHPKGLTDLILSQEEIEELRSLYNKKQISSLNQKWSVSEIIKEFSQSSDQSLQVMVALLHNYMSSSHLAHMDATGVGMVWDQYQRAAVNGRAKSLAHAGRLIIDCCTLATTRATFLLRMLNEEKNKSEELKSIYKKFNILVEETEESHKQFEKIEYETQK